MFIEPPSDFPILYTVTKSLGKWGVGQPPDDINGIGLKIKKIFLSTPESDWDNISQIHWKNLPYAFWVDGIESFANHSNIIDHYFNVKLREVEKTSLGHKRWIKPLLFTYVNQFDSSHPLILRIANTFLSWINLSPLISGSKLYELHNELSFFSPHVVGSKLAMEILRHPEAHEVGNSWISSRGLWAGFISSALAIHAYNHLVDQESSIINEEQLSYSFMRWSFEGSNYKHLAPLHLFTNALLTPWISKDPSNQLREHVVKLYTLQLKNEHPRQNSGHWSEVSSEAKAVINRWITGESLDMFFRILSESAESMWEDRKKFWNALFRNRLIDDAWPVLGRDAIILAKKMGLSYKAYAELKGAQSQQSVLLMRIGDRVFAEWTHSGSLRVAKHDAIFAPKLFKTSYKAENLRFDSEFFDDSSSGGLRHQGQWQIKAIKFLIKNLGIQLREYEYFQ